MRNVVTLNHLEPDLHRWLKDEAARRTREEGHRVGIWELVQTSVQDYKAKCDDARDPVAAGEVSHAD